MEEQNASRNWRGYAAWGSLGCGAAGVIMTIGIMAYIDLSQKHPYDKWESGYFLVGLPISMLGVILGCCGKDTPRGVGLVLSSLVLCRIIMGAIAM